MIQLERETRTPWNTHKRFLATVEEKNEEKEKEEKWRIQEEGEE